MWSMCWKKKSLPGFRKTKQHLCKSYWSVFWAVTLCSLTFNPTARGDIFLCSAGVHIHNCTLSQTQRLQTENKTEVPP